VGSLGVLAWLTAVIAAAVAYRRAGAPALVPVLLGLSAIVVSHPPPIGPVGLACFATAVGLLSFSRRSKTAVEIRSRALRRGGLKRAGDTVTEPPA
jgi:hypothetical protein